MCMYLRTKFQVASIILEEGWGVILTLPPQNGGAGSTTNNLDFNNNSRGHLFWSFTTKTYNTYYKIDNIVSMSDD